VSQVLIYCASITHGTVILPSEKTLPARLNMDLITALQTKVAPQIFTPRAVYDGRKNLFAARELRFAGGEKSQEVIHVTSTYIYDDANDAWL
jgi:eukaryotic translation initiation factor 2C